MAEPREIQERFVLTDDLTPYRGSWVAVRDGKVVAATVNARQLRDLPDVRDSDWVMLAPITDGPFLLAVHAGVLAESVLDV